MKNSLRSPLFCCWLLLLGLMSPARATTPPPATGRPLAEAELDLRGLPAGTYLVRCGAVSQRLLVE